MSDEGGQRQGETADHEQCDENEGGVCNDVRWLDRPHEWHHDEGQPEQSGRAGPVITHHIDSEGVPEKADIAFRFGRSAAAEHAASLRRTWLAGRRGTPHHRRKRVFENGGRLSVLDGRHEIALVKTPHIGGTLEMWELRGSDEAGWELVMEDALHGFSNHAYGSPIQDLSEAVDWNGDGIVDLVLPGASRRSIRIMSFAGGKLSEIENIQLPGTVVTEVASIRRQDGSISLLTGLDTHQLAIISTK